MFLNRIFTRSIVLFLLTILNTDIQADPNGDLFKTIPEWKTSLKELSKKSEWRNLLVYKNKLGSSSGYKSDIISESFFFAKDGNINPFNELKATIEAFSRPLVGTPDEHPQCQFKGRFVWLNYETNLTDFLPTIVDCPEYNVWSFNGKIESLSLVYATGYLGNPASYYGHMLLKLNSKDRESLTSLEDIAVNFGAIIPESDGMIPYIIKGVTGGYDSGFTHSQYFHHTHNYGENELRNLWEYELNLTDRDRAIILGHTWELLKNKYTYYFLNKNCAYRMAELLSVVDSINLTPKKPMWVIPQSILLKMNRLTYGNKLLVNAIHFKPSRQSRLYTRFEQLSTNEQEFVKNIILDQEKLFDSVFENTTVESKQKILDTLLDYYKYIEVAHDDLDTAEKYRQVLFSRYQLPPGESKHKQKIIRPPTQGRNPSYVSIGSQYYENQSQSDMELRIRPAYYDSLDFDSGHIPFASLSMADTVIYLRDQQVKLKSLTFFHVNAVNSKVTGLPEDKGHAWFLSAGLHQYSASCSPNCLVPKVATGIGYAYGSANDRFIVSSYVFGSAQEKYEQFNILDLGVKLNTAFSIGSATRFEIDLQYRDDFDTLNELESSFTVRRRLSKNTDLRVNYKKADDKIIGVSFGTYW